MQEPIGAECSSESSANNNIGTVSPCSDKNKTAFNHRLLDLWAENRMTLDKSFLQLSAAGIGLLVALLTTTTSWLSLEFWLCSVALFCFLLSIIICLCIFRQNSRYLLAVSRGEESPQKNRLKWLDRLLWGFFHLAIAFAVLAGYTSCYNKLS